jgi:hypothetical protein
MWRWKYVASSSPTVPITCPWAMLAPVTTAASMLSRCR